jgi:hypothetical protein
LIILSFVMKRKGDLVALTVNTEPKKDPASETKNTDELGLTSSSGPASTATGFSSSSTATNDKKTQVPTEDDAFNILFRASTGTGTGPGGSGLSGIAPIPSPSPGLDDCFVNLPSLGTEITSPQKKKQKTVTLTQATLTDLPGQIPFSEELKSIRDNGKSTYTSVRVVQILGVIAPSKPGASDGTSFGAFACPTVLGKTEEKADVFCNEKVNVATRQCYARPPHTVGNQARAIFHIANLQAQIVGEETKMKVTVPQETISHFQPAGISYTQFSALTMDGKKEWFKSFISKPFPTRLWIRIDDKNNVASVTLKLPA